MRIRSLLTTLVAAVTIAGGVALVAYADGLGATTPGLPPVSIPTDAPPTVEPSPDPEPTAPPTVEPRPTPEPSAPATDEPADPGAEEPTGPASPEPGTDEPDEPADEPDDEHGYDVVEVQTYLRDAGYYVGPIDGIPGAATTSAIQAFQKVNGLYGDGVVGPKTLAALADPAEPTLRGGEATRIEVDLTRQVAYLVRDGRLVRVLPVSSGNGETYRTASGGTARALTPVGDFRIERRIAGVRVAPLGTLYDPLYFHRGWALHGSNSVPPYPASHGCVRLTRWDATWLFDQVTNGAQVRVYGGTHTFASGGA
jgi:lipoprotein-anchoring transpeptidase ErfK/SrfK